MERCDPVDLLDNSGCDIEITLGGQEDGRKTDWEACEK